jgi:hypothetical protein
LVPALLRVLIARVWEKADFGVYRKAKEEGQDAISETRTSFGKIEMTACW